MRNLVIAAVLILTPAIAFAQSGQKTTAAANSGARIYGPPAPPVVNRGPSAVARDAESKPAAAGDSASVTRKHKGRRKGSYVGMESGAMR